MPEFDKPAFSYPYQVNAQIQALRTYRDTKEGSGVVGDERAGLHGGGTPPRMNGGLAMHHKAPQSGAPETVVFVLWSEWGLRSYLSRLEGGG